MLHRMIRFAILCLVELFYPRIETQGREQVSRSGPAIFVLNHLNGRLDPLLLMVRIRRPIAFLANSLARLCMDPFGTLPVFRQRDLSMSQM